MKETSNSQTWDLVQLINNYSNDFWINLYETQDGPFKAGLIFAVHILGYTLPRIFFKTLARSSLWEPRLCVAR